MQPFMFPTHALDMCNRSGDISLLQTEVEFANNTVNKTPVGHDLLIYRKMWSAVFDDEGRL